MCSSVDDSESSYPNITSNNLQDDLFESKTTKDPMVGIWFRIEQGPPVGPGVHAYDESGVVFEGTDSDGLFSLKLLNF
jgi:hypothetical protein